ncbi:MAG: fucose pyrophosphorylase domain-containing protein [Phycisphaerales bacterium]
MAACDLLIITAANEQQARQYRRRLAAAGRRGPLRDVGRTLIIADPLGRRVGSGAASINALLLAASLLCPRASSIERAFEGRRVLMLHSGGDSRRLPAYAAAGKLFAPTPCLTREGLPARLLDLVLEDFLSMAWPAAGAALIAAGDVLLNLARCAPRLDGDGVTAVACPGDLARAARHGVYVASRGRDGRARVRDFLQKAAEPELRARGAIDERGEVAIDTGVLALSPRAAGAWAEAAGVARPGRVPKGSLADLIRRGMCAPMDLYVHSIMAMTPAIGVKAFAATIAKDAPPAARDALRRYRERIRRAAIPFGVETVPCDFIHVGTTREFIAAVLEPSRWRSLVAPREDRRLLHADAAIAAPEGARVVVEGSRRCTVRCEGDALVAGVVGPAKLDLPADTGLSCVRVGASSWACVAFGLDDDCKTTLEAGGRFGAFTLAELPSRLGLSEDSLFPAKGERSLWTARLWRPGPRARTLREAQQLLRGIAPSRAWAASPRIALADLVRLARADDADHASPIEPASVASLLEAGAQPDLGRLAASLRTPARARRAARALDALIRGEAPPLAQARAIRLRSMLDGRDWGDAALAAVRLGVERIEGLPSEPARVAVHPGRTVLATSPVRIDLAGGWSDTPPICHERGGIVVNMAVLLEGAAPIRATVRRLDRPVIRVRSVDLSREAEWSHAAPLCDYADPTDWSALAKAALVLSGLVPSHPRDDLQGWLRAGSRGAPRGIEVALEAAVPKGSGLGTSSILAATLLAALDAFKGAPEPAIDDLVTRTMLLEQMMSTGGGWQDQCGGVVGGIKCASTPPGERQRPQIEQLPLGPRCREALEDRAILCFTGVQRLAKHILRQVVHRHLDGGPACRRIIDDLRQGASHVRGAIERDDPDAMTLGLADYWRLKRAIDPGAFDTRLAARLATLTPHAAAWELPGAGGGGFAFLLARDRRSMAVMRRAIRAMGEGDAAIREYAWSIATTGVSVEIR